MIMSSDECHRTLQIISQHWFRWCLGAVRQQAITWTSVDQDLQCHMVTLGPNELKKGLKKKPIYSCSDFPPPCIWQKHQQLINWQKHTFPSKLHNYNIGTLLNVEIAWLLHTWWAQRCMLKLSNRQYIPALKKSKTLDTKDFYSDILWYYTWGDFYRKCSRYLSLI